jgi:hypothetical protein
MINSIVGAFYIKLKERGDKAISAGRSYSADDSIYSIFGRAL